jgi:pyridoxal phosphate enzyme (YggS family)
MVAHRFRLVVDRIDAAAARAGRDPETIKLVVVSKARTTDEVRQVYDAGHRDFGENRADELAAKAPLLPDDIRWHFVGTVQRRKVAAIRHLTYLLHSMDRASLAMRWAAPGEPVPPCLLQVNIGEEPQKHGVLPARADAALEEMAGLGIAPVGLMAIPPAPERPEDSRPHFEEMARLAGMLRRDRPGLVELSMGMSDDFEVAIESGATLVRVGTAIFGPRTSDGPRVWG